MQTLLHKVQAAEEAERARIAAAREQAQRTLETLLGEEDRILTAAKSQAEGRGRAIAGEKIEAAQAEVNQMRQQAEAAIAQIHAAAERNRADALARAWQLFQDTYIAA